MNSVQRNKWRCTFGASAIMISSPGPAKQRARLYCHHLVLFVISELRSRAARRAPRAAPCFLIDTPHKTALKHPATRARGDAPCCAVGPDLHLPVHRVALTSVDSLARWPRARRLNLLHRLDSPSILFAQFRPRRCRSSFLSAVARMSDYRKVSIYGGARIALASQEAQQVQVRYPLIVARRSSCYQGARSQVD